MGKMYEHWRAEESDPEHRYCYKKYFAKLIPVGSLSVFCTILNHAGLTFYSENQMLEMLRMCDITSHKIVTSKQGVPCSSFPSGFSQQSSKP
jgi:hypothetical protein